MVALRWFFVAAFFGCIAVVAANARWEARLVRANHTWIVDLGRSPVWAPPSSDITYARFKKDFSESNTFPTEDAPGTTIQRSLKIEWMAADFMLYLWPVSIVAGLLYLTLRGSQRDLILHVGMSVGIGLTTAVVVCVGIWILFGGWGPPAPEVFGGLGLLVGIIAGLGSFGPRPPEGGPASDHGAH